MRVAHKLNRLFLASLIFTAAYMTTITVKANAQATGDAIQLEANSETSLQGRIEEIEDNFLIVDSSGKKIKVVLDDVEMNAPADTMFQKGMYVSVAGKISGDDFGTMILDAKSITATEGGAATYIPTPGAPAPVVVP